MSQVVDPILDYFLQIPIEQANIVTFLNHHGFQASKIQHPNGETKSIVFYYTQYPSKSVHFPNNPESIENFLYALQQNFFMVLDEKEMSFLIKTPRSAYGIAIEKGNNEMEFPIRTISYIGENRHNTENIKDYNTTLTVNNKKNDAIIIPHPILQKIFITFIKGKKILELSEIIDEYKQFKSKHHES